MQRGAQMCGRGVFGATNIPRHVHLENFQGHAQETGHHLSRGCLHTSIPFLVAFPGLFKNVLQCHPMQVRLAAERVRAVAAMLESLPFILGDRPEHADSTIPQSASAFPQTPIALN